jgi:hypothetical protein
MPAPGVLANAGLSTIPAARPHASAASSIRDTFIRKRVAAPRRVDANWRLRHKERACIRVLFDGVKGDQRYGGDQMVLRGSERLGGDGSIPFKRRRELREGAKPSACFGSWEFVQ